MAHTGKANDAVVEMRVLPQARKKGFALPGRWRARAIAVTDRGARKKVLLTSLPDQQRYTAADIANCYARCRQIETCYRKLKQTMHGMTLTLRSRTVDGVYQEAWGVLTAVN
jgi:hypothetical protein